MKNYIKKIMVAQENWKDTDENIVSSPNCNHDLGDLNNTLITSNRRTMVSPEEVECVCKICRKSFKFLKTGLGTYVQI